MGIDGGENKIDADNQRMHYPLCHWGFCPACVDGDVFLKKKIQTGNGAAVQY